MISENQQWEQFYAPCYGFYPNCRSVVIRPEDAENIFSFFLKKCNESSKLQKSATKMFWIFTGKYAHCLS